MLCGSSGVNGYLYRCGYSPETITTLLISHTLIKKKFNKKIKNKYTVLLNKVSKYLLVILAQQ